MGAPIKDQFSDLDVCRQRRYQLRKKAVRLCTQCGGPALLDMTRCAACHTRCMKLVYQHQGTPKRKAKTTKFIRATSLPDPPEVKQ
jgi:hypothetical protein